MTNSEAQIYFSNTLKTLTADSQSYQSWGNVNILEGSLRLSDSILRGYFKDGELKFQEIPLQQPKSLHAAIFRKRKKINAIFITQQTNAGKVKETIPPILDDQAQLLGPSLKYIRLTKINQITPQIVKGLSGRFAAILSNEQCVCIGKNMEEAYVAAQLVEKTSKAFLEAKHLGGSKSINIIEAWLMHKFYLLKYSKESEKNR
jgi:hypothetical protein